MFQNAPANVRLASGKWSHPVYYPTGSLLKNRDRVRSQRVRGTRKPLSYHSDSFSCAAHANPVLLKLDNTATSLSTQFSGVSKSVLDSLFRRHQSIYNALWSSPERSFRRDCGRFGWYLRSYREQCLSGCYRVWAQATGRSWPILGKVLRDAIMSSLLRESTYLGSCRRRVMRITLCIIVNVAASRMSPR